MKSSASESKPFQRALVKPVTVNTRDGQNLTTVTDASRDRHVSVTANYQLQLPIIQSFIVIKPLRINLYSVPA